METVGWGKLVTLKGSHKHRWQNKNEMPTTQQLLSYRDKVKTQFGNPRPVLRSPSSGCQIVQFGAESGSIPPLCTENDSLNKSGWEKALILVIKQQPRASFWSWVFLAWMEGDRSSSLIAVQHEISSIS